MCTFPSTGEVPLLLAKEHQHHAGRRLWAKGHTGGAESICGVQVQGDCCRECELLK